MDTPRQPLNAVTHAPTGTARGTVVLLHGLTDSGASWADAVARWTSTGWTVVTVDARGHGHSPRWTSAELESGPGDVMAADVAAIVTGLGDPVALVGHSMGAAVAVAAAAHAPDHVWAVVAEDPPWPLPPRQPDAARALQYVLDHAADLSTPPKVRTDRRRAESPTWPESELEPWAHAVEQTDAALLATGDIVPRTPWPELVARLSASDVPLLVVTGDHDVLVDEASEAAALHEGADVARLAGAGHCVRRDVGDAYHAVVDTFLAQPPPSPRDRATRLITQPARSAPGHERCTAPRPRRCHRSVRMA